MYERFTDRCRKVMQLANQESQRFNLEYIGVESILLGLLKEGTGVGCSVMRGMEVSVEKLAAAVAENIVQGPSMVTMGKLPQTPAAKKVIEYAIEDARNLQHNYVGTEHLLLGLIRCKESPFVWSLLKSVGLELESVRTKVREVNRCEPNVVNPSMESGLEAKTAQQVAWEWSFNCHIPSVSVLTPGMRIESLQGLCGFTDKSGQCFTFASFVDMVRFLLAWQRPMDTETRTALEKLLPSEDSKE